MLHCCCKLIFNIITLIFNYYPSLLFTISAQQILIKIHIITLQNTKALLPIRFNTAVKYLFIVTKPNHQLIRKQTIDISRMIPYASRLRVPSPPSARNFEPNNSFISRSRYNPPYRAYSISMQSSSIIYPLCEASNIKN